MGEVTETHDEMLEKIVRLSDCNDVLNVNDLFDSRLYGGEGVTQRQIFAHDIAYLLEFGLIQYEDDFGRCISLTSLGRKILNVNYVGGVKGGEDGKSKVHM